MLNHLKWEIKLKKPDKNSKNKLLGKIFGWKISEILLSEIKIEHKKDNWNIDTSGLDEKLTENLQKTKTKETREKIEWKIKIDEKSNSSYPTSIWFNPEKISYINNMAIKLIFEWNIDNPYKLKNPEAQREYSFFIVGWYDRDNKIWAYYKPNMIDAIYSSDWFMLVSTDWFWSIVVPNDIIIYFDFKTKIFTTKKMENRVLLTPLEKYEKDYAASLNNHFDANNIFNLRIIKSWIEFKKLKEIFDSVYNDKNTLDSVVREFMNNYNKEV